MEIIIHQSQCGENIKKAWDLLKTTMPDIAIAKKLAFHTSLHDEAGGIVWKPTIRGFLQEDFFLLIKTFPDKSPEVRPGRVFSHVLLISKNDIDSVLDIASLFKFLPDSIDKSIELKPIRFNPNEISNLSLPSGFQERFNKAIHGFKNANDYKNTIIWVGEENFEVAIYKFWQMLSLREKENFNFGIYFNLAVIPNEKLNLITIPENIETKFINSGFCVIRKNDTQILTDISEQFLAGDANAGKRIKKFELAIESKPLNRADIDKIAIIIKTFENIDSISDLKKVNTLSHIIAEYSPNENNGMIFKETVVNKISRLIEDCDVKEISLVRKFNLLSFKGSEKEFSLSINKWLDKNLFSESESNKKNYSILFTQLNELVTSNWWTKLIGDRIKRFLSKINNKSAKIVFNWLKADFGIFDFIKSDIDNSKESENCFTLQVISFSDKSRFGALKEFAAKRNWYKFHATLLTLEYSFEKAMTEQLEIDTNLTSIEGIEIIIQKAKPKTIIDFAVTNGNQRLLKIAGKLCVENPFLLEKIDFSNSNWQEVWLYSIINGNEVVSGFKDPQKTIFKLFDSIVEGQSVNEILLDKICETGFGNILTYPKRESLWNKMPVTIQVKFLAKTASTFLESLSKDSTVEIPNDRILTDYLIKDGIGNFIYTNRNNIKSVIPIFNKLSGISENYLKNYINSYTGDIDVIDAAELGKVVYARRYSGVASVIYSKTNSQNNWRIALKECYLLLNTLTQMSIAFWGLVDNIKITKEQWWLGAEDIIVDLFSNGNSITTIWKKAGGDEADILVSGTARELWHDLIAKIKNEKFGPARMNTLLIEMVKLYPGNERLQTIIKLQNSFTSS